MNNNTNNNNIYSSVQLLKGKYDIISVLGHGGFGEVYKVKNKQTGGLFAAKQVKISQKEDLEQALNEFLLVANNLSHPNIVKVFEYEKKEDEFVFIMELGLCNLKEEIDKVRLTEPYREDDHIQNSKGIFPFKQALSIIRDVTSALAYAISKNINYGDVKPPNILKFENSYKVADWGTASLKDYGAGSTKTVGSSRSIVGTLLYMAPELQEIYERDINISVRGIRNDKQKVRINFEKTDVFSLGLLILEVYFGFSRKNMKNIKQKIIEDPKFKVKELSYLLTKLKMDCDPNFCYIVASMLSLDHEARPDFKTLDTIFNDYEAAIKKFPDFPAAVSKGEEPTIVKSSQKEKNNELSDSVHEIEEKKGVDEDSMTGYKNKSDPALNQSYEEDVSITQLIRGGERKDLKENAKDPIKKLNDRIATKFIKWNKFFDFEVNPALLDTLKSLKKCIVVSISGKSGLGKSTTLNMLLSILSQYDHIRDEEYEFKFYEVFKVGDGAHGTTDGLDLTIVRLDEERSFLLVDLQGSNDKRSGEQWKFLYFSLFYILFLISDIHFFLYEGNLEEISQSELNGIIKEKEKSKEVKTCPEELKVWNKQTELITLRKNTQKKLTGERLKKMIEEHKKKALDVYGSNYYKNNTFFIRQNDHFDTIDEEICINKGEICGECREKECFQTLIEIADYLHKNLMKDTEKGGFVSHQGEKILSELHYIFKEVQERRYMICFQSGNLIEEYLNHAKWCYQLKCEKIKKYDFVVIFNKVFGEKFFLDNKSDEDRLKTINKLAKNFGLIYLNALEFSKFLETNLEEHGNNILQIPEAEFIKNTFIAKFEECHRKFIKHFKPYLDSKSFTRTDFSKAIKNRLKELYSNIKAQTVSEKVEMKMNFCELIFKKNKREGFIYYLLLNEDSIQEMMKDDLIDDDKFDYSHAVCGLKFAELMIGVETVRLLKLEKNVENLKDFSKRDHEELLERMKKQGYDKNKEIIKMLYRMKKTLEIFLEEYDTKLKILMD